MRSLVWSVAFVVAWSSGFVGAALAAPAGSVWTVLAWRYALTASLLVVLALALRRPWPRGRALTHQVVLGLLAHVVFLGGVFAAADAGVDAGSVALVCAMQPMLVTVVGRVGWGDAVAPRQVVGLLVGLAAVALSVGGAAGLGPLLALPVASLLGLSGAALLERRWEPRTDLVTALTVEVVVGAAVFATVAAATDGLALEPTGDVVVALVWLVLLSGVLGYAAFTACLRRLGSTTTSLLLYLTPPVTTLWAWAMLGSTPAPAQWLGLLLGAVAVALALPRVTHLPRPTRPTRPTRPDISG